VTSAVFCSFLLPSRYKGPGNSYTERSAASKFITFNSSIRSLNVEYVVGMLSF